MICPQALWSVQPIKYTDIYVISPALLCPQDFEGTVYTFGFGSDHNGDLLTAISNAANGVYYFIDSTEKVLYA